MMKKLPVFFRITISGSVSPIAFGYTMQGNSISLRELEGNSKAYHCLYRVSRNLAPVCI